MNGPYPDLVFVGLVPRAPTILSQPANQTVPCGLDAAFEATASGTLPLMYQWSFDGIALPGQTNSSLVISTVDATNAGSYQVVVTNQGGAATSAVATLTVNIPQTAPQIITCDGCFGFLTNQFGFNVSGAIGQTIVVDGSTDLVNWTPLVTNTVCGNPFYFCDPASTNFLGRFYRARLP